MSQIKCVLCGSVVNIGEHKHLETNETIAFEFTCTGCGVVFRTPSTDYKNAVLVYRKLSKTVEPQPAEISDLMVYAFLERTFKHIHRVQKNMLYLLFYHSRELGIHFEDIQVFAANAMKHDFSKFSDDQFLPYAVFQMKKNLKQECTQDEIDAFEGACKAHYASENHHPERLIGKAEGLTGLEMIEIVCDLQAMSQELGEKSCREYFENTWCVFKANCFFDIYKWELTKEYMRRIITCLEAMPQTASKWHMAE